jgi:metal-responsive CopG/Arc/MetJ family transcriptional regulator
MQTIQVVLDEQLLTAADRAAKRSKQNRSAWVRDAMREHLRATHIRALEEKDREGYRRYPQTEEEIRMMDAMSQWLPE